MYLPICPNCNFEFPYENWEYRICSNCDHTRKEDEKSDAHELIVIDSNGNRLADWDSIIIIKDLKFKWWSIKQGTKVKNIRLVDGDHNIDCKVEGIWAMALKSEFVKKI